MGNGPYDLLKGIYKPLLERFRKAALDPGAAQRTRLRELLAANTSSEYGRKHGFSVIRDEAEFRARVPRNEWDDLAPLVDRIADGEQGILTTEPVRSFVKTSGTTGPAKRIPVTRSLAREVRDAQIVWLVNMLRENPRHASGKRLVLTSPAESETTDGGLPVGANTGRMARELPWFVRVGRVPRPEVLAIRDPEVRGFLTALAAAGAELGSISTANPSTIWQLAKRLREWSGPLAEALEQGGIPDQTPTGQRIPPGVAYVLGKQFPRRAKRAEALRRAQGSGALFPALWPTLSAVNCWRGGPAAFWLEKLARELGGVPVRDVGVSASEGFFAVPLESGTAAGVLLCAGPYIELEPVGGGEPIGVEGAVEGKEYELRVTTCGGLWRYAMRDVIKVTGRWEKAPLVEFVRKAGAILSITGEKVTEPQVLAAALETARECGVSLGAAGAMIDSEVMPPRYVGLFELEGDGAGMAETLARAFDAALRRANVEYEGKRSDGRLGPPVVRLLPPGSFEARRRALLQGGAPDAQVKTPVLFPSGW